MLQVGFQTWYEGSEERYIQKCKSKDSATTQASLGFKICGMQVFRWAPRRRPLPEALLHSRELVACWSVRGIVISDLGR